MAPSERAKQMRGSADRGSLEALTVLGLWHLLGKEGLEKDDVKAAALFREAAILGHASAQSQRTTCYYNGTGEEQSDALAAEWGRKAADQGEAEAQGIVGTMYALGEGVKTGPASGEAKPGAQRRAGL